MKQMANKKIKIIQIKSGIGRKQDQKDTLKGLGLSKLGKIRELDDTEAIRGMVNKIKHLVKIV